MLQIIQIPDLPMFQPNDDIAQIISEKYADNLKNNDILVIAHTIVSRVENCEIEYEKVQPSMFAVNFANSADKDPRIVEIVLQEAKSIVRMSESLLITETHHGFICANSGVDRSNARPGHVLTLPKDPDKSARKIKKRFEEINGLDNINIIISDTFGRPFRIGTTNIAIGIAGLDPFVDCSFKSDLFGYKLQHSIVAVADELACTAGLIMGQSNEGIPVVIIRGFTNYTSSSQSSATRLNRKREDALFW